jgi:hypothetical protein
MQLPVLISEGDEFNDEQKKGQSQEFLAEVLFSSDSA